MKSTVILFVGVLVFAGLYVDFLPRDQRAQEEMEDEETSTVTESEIETYIEVYKAMQVNHALKIDEAVKAQNVTLEEFRNIERRIQKEQRFVDRVRKELLECAQGGAPVPPLTPDEEQLAPSEK